MKNGQLTKLIKVKTSGRSGKLHFIVGLLVSIAVNESDLKGQEFASVVTNIVLFYNKKSKVLQRTMVKQIKEKL